MPSLMQRARRLSATFISSELSTADLGQGSPQGDGSGRSSSNSPRSSPQNSTTSLLKSEGSIASAWRNDGSSRASSQDLLSARDAASRGDIAYLEKMTRKHPEAVFAKDPKGGQTVAHKAAAAGKLEVLQFLHQKNRHILHVKDDMRGSFPAHYAAREGHDEILADMAEHHPECLKMPDNHGRTPLDLGLLRGARDGSVKKIKTMTMLSPSSIKAVEHEFDHGYTAAHIAACYGHLDALKFILHLAPELIRRKDCNQNSVADCARIAGHESIVDYLRETYSSDIQG
mmetsp:Transcript_16752/g.26011  ORF Transcript_16752/g.26011 Transcript_16752/m.26011 type:complete len:286 (-) Transcript_16752:77-934(-)|eukprot:CAMPEP_0184295540 /NCGR_PEP_ID=MMETSP1049-20130417/6386_1 /TAXON_ID=77928 /ORGANISM="Proteomonas sulcata, Strain CCMP704" /LENGTH=285 /DNA_ID=CAMNT_0026604117 /DNA_START=144 /DNA_END=1001 /DNA_ORIENTATION=+